MGSQKSIPYAVGYGGCDTICIEYLTTRKNYFERSSAARAYALEDGSRCGATDDFAAHLRRKRSSGQLGLYSFSLIQNITITTQSLSRRRAKKIRSLSRKKYREEYGEFIVEGRRAVDAALEAQAPVVEMVVAKSAFSDARVQALTEKSAGTVYLCPDDEFQKVSQVQHAQGVLAVVESRLRAADELRDGTSIVALDGVQDPGNAGTLLRTAAWFGVDGVIAGPGTVDLTNPKVVRAAMGAHWELELAAAEDLRGLIERFRASGITPYAADLGGTPVAHWQPETPSLLVLGSEAHGISASVREQVNQRVYVARPAVRSSHPGGVESLNVAVASGIVLHYWLQ